MLMFCSAARLMWSRGRESVTQPFILPWKVIRIDWHKPSSLFEDIKSKLQRPKIIPMPHNKFENIKSPRDLMVVWRAIEMSSFCYKSSTTRTNIGSTWCSTIISVVQKERKEHTSLIGQKVYNPNYEIYIYIYIYIYIFIYIYIYINKSNQM